MVHAHGEVIATPGGEAPFRAIIKHGDQEILNRPASSAEEARAILNAILQKLRESKDGEPDAPRSR